MHDELVCISLGHLDSGVFDIALDAAHHLDCNLLPVLGVVGLFFVFCP